MVFEVQPEEENEGSGDLEDPGMNFAIRVKEVKPKRVRSRFRPSIDFNKTLIKSPKKPSNSLLGRKGGNIRWGRDGSFQLTYQAEKKSTPNGDKEEATSQPKSPKNVTKESQRRERKGTIIPNSVIEKFVNLGFKQTGKEQSNALFTNPLFLIKCSVFQLLVPVLPQSPYLLISLLALNEVLFAIYLIKIYRRFGMFLSFVNFLRKMNSSFWLLFILIGFVVVDNSGGSYSIENAIIIMIVLGVVVEYLLTFVIILQGLCAKKKKKTSDGVRNIKDIK